MPLSLTLLLVFVSALEQRTWARSGSSSHPSIWAVPGAVVPRGGSVSIFCRVLPGVTHVRLSHEEPGGRWDHRNTDGAQDAVNFSLSPVAHIDAGRYYCHYWQDTWRERSESLELVVTGVYRDKPSLTAHPAAQVALGGNVTLQCQPGHPYDTYILCRGGGASFPQDCSRQSHSSFLIFPMSLDQAGTYTCYGSPKDNSPLWSLPSDPLVLSVTCPDVPIAVVASAAAAAAFLLLVLLFLLVLCLCRRRAKRRAAYDGTKGPMRRESSSPPMLTQRESADHDLQDAKPEADGQGHAQVPAEEGAQEVTYAELHALRPGAGEDPLLPHDSETPFADTCVYATLTRS